MTKPSHCQLSEAINKLNDCTEMSYVKLLLLFSLWLYLLCVCVDVCSLNVYVSENGLCARIDSPV